VTGVRGAVLLAVGCCLLVGASGWGASAAQPPRGEIRGVVVDGTRPVRPLPGQLVRLEVVERGATSEQQRRAGPRGEVRFAGLPLGGVRVFLLRTDYRGVAYTSDRIVLTPRAPVRSVVLRVYEPTSDQRAVRSLLLFSLLEAARGTVRVSTVERFENPTDRAVVTAQTPLVFPLPEGARDVVFLAGWRDPRLVGTRIEDTPVLLPGVHQVSYSYEVTARGGVAEVPWRLPYGAREVDVLAAASGVRLAVLGLRRVEDVTAEGRRFQRWSGGPVLPGGRVVVRIAGVPPGRSAWPAGLAAVLGGLLAAGLLGGLARSRGRRARGGEGAGGVEAHIPASCPSSPTESVG
jgi:hypothetical protein